MIEVRNARWINQEKTRFNCEIKPIGFDKFIPFTYDDSDNSKATTWIKKNWIESNKNHILDYSEPDSLVVYIPFSVSKFQAVAALANAGLLGQVQSYIDAEPEDSLTKLAWDHAQEFRRQSPSVLAIGAALGLSDQDLDALFVTASTIQA